MSGYEETRFTSTSFAGQLAETWCGSAPWASKERKKNAEEAVKSELLDVLMVEEVFTGKRRRKNKAKAEANAMALREAEDAAKIAREAAPKKAVSAYREPEKQPVIRPDVTDAPYDGEESTVLDEEFLKQLREAADE